MKKLIFQKYNQLALLFILSLLAGVLLMFRIKVTQSFFMLFLVWNIFLAAIPYAITFLVQLKPSWFTPKSTRALTFLVWLLFLPNAPYIISDFTHLQWTSSSMLLLDASIIGLFGLLGLLYMVYSIVDMQRLFLITLSRKQQLLFTICTCILIGFGIYLGRYLRWNSWDVLQNPLGLLGDIGTIVIHPLQHRFAWLVTVGYALLSWISIAIVNKLRCTR